MRPMTHVLLVFLFLTSFLAASRAHAFKITSALTDGCHEKITLGAFGRGDPGFTGDRQPSLDGLFQRFLQRAQLDGVPDDDSSSGFRRENARRYSWERLSEVEKYILASFIAGVRAPDTGGYSIVDFSQIRGSHIRDEEQSAHFLRRKDQDGTAGDVAIIQETRARIEQLAAGVLSAWSSTETLQRKVRWTFAFYGEHDVVVFGPAYDLGLIAHVVQDSYAHAIRDENDLAILAVENYLDLMMGSYNEQLDGPGHSERLDQCNQHDAFDLPRIDIARKQTANTLNALDVQMNVNGQDLTGLRTTLDQVFTYRAGCSLSNQFCNSLWYRKAKEEISEPYEVGCGLVRSRSHSHDDDHGAGLRGPWWTVSTSLSRNAMVFFLLAVLPLLTALGLRRRQRV